MTTGPAAVPVARVPRSRVDDFYAPSTPLPEIRIGTAIVVSLDGDTATVLMFDEEITGVVWLGFTPPAVGDAVEIEARGDLLVIADSYDEGESTGAAHIVDDSDPGGPEPVEVNIGGGMRTADPWTFDANAHGWRRALDASGVGIRAWQLAGVLKARNSIPNPSFETGLTGWASNTVAGTQPAATLTQDAVRFLFGTKSMRVDWPAVGALAPVSNAVHALALDPAKRWVLSIHVYVPEGSPDVRATVLTTAGPWISAREAWTWTDVEFQGSAGGNLAGVETHDPTLGTMCWVDAVVVREAGTPLPTGLTYFDGSLPNTAERSFVWEGTAHASASTWYDGQVGAPGIGTLWSTEPFDVRPGDRLDLTAVLSKTAGADATAQLAICYSPDPELAPATMTDPVITYGVAVAIAADDTPFAATATVPDTLPDGISTPARAVVGFRLNGPGTSDLVVDSADLTRTDATWPIGSLWLNPAAGQALPTVGVSATGPTSGGQLNASQIWTPCANAKKAIVTAPSDTGGIVMVFSTFGVVGVTANQVAVEFTHFVDGVDAGLPMSRLNTAGMASSGQQAVTCIGTVIVDVGATVEIVLRYKYAAAAGATLNSIRGHTMTAIFIPAGVAAGSPSRPAPVSFWDGNSWRPGDLDPAAMDLSKDGNTVEPATTATTTTISRSDGDVHANANVTLTATVTPAAAAGTVTFYRATSSGGPWTSLGSASIAAGTSKATKVVSASSSITYYYRATYGGSATHASSTSASTTVRYRTRTSATKTYNAKWVQAYNGDGAKVTAGTGYDAAVHQGVASSGSGNRRSLIGFNQPSFGGTDVEVTRVTLVCKDWHQWMAGNNQGTVVVGWHEVTGASEPGSYPFDRTHNDRSSYGRGEGSWTANLTSWADAIVMRSDFGGISIGPGPNGSAEFYGWSDNGASKWQLEVEADSWS
jgi:hypothetical protein